MPDEKVLRQIADLRKHLGLSYVQLGTMLGVKDQPGRTVWCWERDCHEEFGTEPLTPAYRAKLDEMHSRLKRLLALFVAKRLR